MEIAVPCPICKLIATCDCVRALTSFFTILERVGKRVLTNKASSTIFQIPYIGAGVDKLDARLKEPIEVSKVLAQARALQLECKIAPLKDRRPYLHIGNGERVIHFSLNFARDSVVGFLSNPNRFVDWSGYLSAVEPLLGQLAIKDASIQRIDLNIDFAMEFTELIQKINIKNKSKAVSFQSKAGDGTGLNIGSRSELMVIYDKAEQNNHSVPYTRLELRLSRTKIPKRSIYELPKYLIHENPFENIEAINVQLTDQTLVEEQKQKLLKFQSILKREGFYSARKAMNKTRNFDRDFAKIIRQGKCLPQPSDFFKSEIQRFLGLSQKSLTLIHSERPNHMQH